MAAMEGGEKGKWVKGVVLGTWPEAHTLSWFEPTQPATKHHAATHLLLPTYSGIGKENPTRGSGVETKGRKVSLTDYSHW